MKRKESSRGMARRTNRTFRLIALWIIAFALLSCAVLGQFAPSGLLEIHYINVQQGGSTLIIGPNGTTILMDAGNNGKGTSEVVP